MLAHHDLVVKLHADERGVSAGQVPDAPADAEAMRRLTRAQGARAVRGARARARAVGAGGDGAVDGGASSGAAASDALPGRRYMLERQRSESERAAANALAERIEHIVGADLVEAKRRCAHAPGVAVSVALLVPTDRALALHEQI